MSGEYAAANTTDTPATKLVEEMLEHMKSLTQQSARILDTLNPQARAVSDHRDAPGNAPPAPAAGMMRNLVNVRGKMSEVSSTLGQIEKLLNG